MHPLHQRLAEGTHRTAMRVAEEASGDPEAVAALVDALASGDATLRNKAASALDLATRRHAALLAPHAPALLAAARADARGPALRRALPLLLGRVPLSREDAQTALAYARRRLADTPATGARANALTALADVAEQHPDLRPALTAELETMMEAPERSLRVRARLLLERLDRL